MLNKIIRIVIIVAVLALVINLVPNVYEWLMKGLNWVLEQGKWGVLALVACVLEAILGN